MKHVKIQTVGFLIFSTLMADVCLDNSCNLAWGDSKRIGVRRMDTGEPSRPRSTIFDMPINGTGNSNATYSQPGYVQPGYVQPVPGTYQVPSSGNTTVSVPGVRQPAYFSGVAEAPMQPAVGAQTPVVVKIGKAVKTKPVSDGGAAIPAYSGTVVSAPVGQVVSQDALNGVPVSGSGSTSKTSSSNVFSQALEALSNPIKFINDIDKDKIPKSDLTSGQMVTPAPVPGQVVVVPSEPLPTQMSQASTPPIGTTNVEVPEIEQLPPIKLPQSVQTQKSGSVSGQVLSNQPTLVAPSSAVGTPAPGQTLLSRPSLTKIEEVAVPREANASAVPANDKSILASSESPSSNQTNKVQNPFLNESEAVSPRKKVSLLSPAEAFGKKVALPTDPIVTPTPEKRDVQTVVSHTGSVKESVETIPLVAPSESAAPAMASSAPGVSESSPAFGKKIELSAPIDMPSGSPTGSLDLPQEPEVVAPETSENIASNEALPSNDDALDGELAINTDNTDNTEKTAESNSQPTFKFHPKQIGKALPPGKMPEDETIESTVDTPIMSSAQAPAQLAAGDPAALDSEEPKFAPLLPNALASDGDQGDQSEEPRVKPDVPVESALNPDLAETQEELPLNILRPIVSEAQKSVKPDQVEAVSPEEIAKEKTDAEMKPLDQGESSAEAKPEELALPELVDPAKLQPLENETPNPVAGPATSADPAEIAGKASIIDTPQSRSVPASEALPTAFTINASGPEEVVFGEKAPVALTVSNTGDADLQEIVLTVTPESEQDAKPVSHTFKRLAAHQSQKITLNLQARTLQPLSLKASLTDSDGRKVETRYQVAVIRPKLKLTCTAPAVVRESNAFALEFQLAAASSLAVKDANVTVTLPEGMELAETAADKSDADKSEADKSDAGRTAQNDSKESAAKNWERLEDGRILWNVDDLNSGEKSRVKLNCRYDRKGPAEIQILVQGENFETQQAVKKLFFEPRDCASLTIVKPEKSAALNEPVPFIVKIQNQQAKQNLDAKIVVYFGEGVEPVRAEGSVYTLGSGVVAFAQGILFKPGETKELKVFAKAEKTGEYPIQVQLLGADKSVKAVINDKAAFGEAASTESESAVANNDELAAIAEPVKPESQPAESAPKLPDLSGLPELSDIPSLEQTSDFVASDSETQNEKSGAELAKELDSILKTSDSPQSQAEKEPELESPDLPELPQEILSEKESIQR